MAKYTPGLMLIRLRRRIAYPARVPMPSLAPGARDEQTGAVGSTARAESPQAGDVERAPARQPRMVRAYFCRVGQRSCGRGCQTRRSCSLSAE